MRARCFSGGPRAAICGLTRTPSWIARGGDNLRDASVVIDARGHRGGRNALDIQRLERREGPCLRSGGHEDRTARRADFEDSAARLLRVDAARDARRLTGLCDLGGARLERASLFAGFDNDAETGDGRSGRRWRRSSHRRSARAAETLNELRLAT